MVYLVLGLEASKNGDGRLSTKGRRVRFGAKADEKSKLTTTVGSSTLTGWNLRERERERR